jgi:tripartite-type tricarboxylate transporter receptor subunit TctC
MLPTRRQLLRAAAILAMAGMHTAFAQQFPSKPIKVVVAASAGTSIDIAARFFSEPLSRRLNTSVVIDNKPGGGGLIGFTAVAKAPADGYTIMLAGIPLYLTPLLSETAPQYDPLKNFVPVARVARVPLAVVVAMDSPYKTLADLLQAMKNKPGELTYSSVGTGSSGNLCAVLLNDMSKTKARSIGYKESSASLTDVTGGRISFTCQGPAGVLPLIQSGKLRALAVTGTTRSEALPDVPTVAEAGIKDYELTSWLDFMAPAGTPPAVLQLLSDEILRIARTPEFKDFAAKQVMSVDAVGYKDLLKDMPNEAARWKRLAQLARGN